MEKSFAESNGLTLRKIANVIWFALPLIIIIFCLLLSVIISEATVDDFDPVEIESDELYVELYDSYLNESICSLEISFNQNVYEGHVTVSFYDVNENLLETLDLYLTSANYDYEDYDTELRNIFFTVKGNVEYYEIIDYSDIETAEADIANEHEGLLALVFLAVLWGFIRLIYATLITLTALFFSCKQYYVNGHCIIVYAGRMHHYIKIDGRKYTEKNALISFSPITLTAELESGERIDVNIPWFTKRMTLHVDGMLIEPTL